MGQRVYESALLGYVTATHQACIDDGATVLTYYYPFTGDVPREAARSCSKWNGKIAPIW